MPGIVDLFPPKEVISYIKNREFQPLLGETLFPERKTPSLDWDLLVGANSAPVSASVHAFDTETEIASREAQKMALEGLLIKRKIPMSEKQIAALMNPRTNEEKAYLENEVFNDAFKMADAVRTRVEAMRMEVLATGKLPSRILFLLSASNISLFNICIPALDKLNSTPTLGSI